ncbi:MAG: hypothetical protein JNK21_15390 [Rhodospirillaceae bacterium]|nr:hypothetical protein [Rhodospirillaceae bacterium]
MPIKKPSPTFMKAVALMLVLSLAPLTIYVLYNRTGGPESQKERAFQKKLRYAFMGESTVVDLGPYTEWEWSTLCAFDANVTDAEMQDVLGFKYKDYDQLHWMPVARYWTLMFVGAPRETNWGMHSPVTPIRIPRDDLANLALPDGKKGVCVPRESGRLVFQRGEALIGVSPITAAVREIAAAEAPTTTAAEPPQ